MTLPDTLTALALALSVHGYDADKLRACARRTMRDADSHGKRLCALVLQSSDPVLFVRGTLWGAA